MLHVNEYNSHFLADSEPSLKVTSTLFQERQSNICSELSKL